MNPIEFQNGITLGGKITPSNIRREQLTQLPQHDGAATMRPDRVVRVSRLKRRIRNCKHHAETYPSVAELS